MIHLTLRHAAASVPAEPAETRVGTFGSLRIRNYRTYFIGQSISAAGTSMQNIAIGWLTLQLSHSGVALGVVTAARYLPILLLGQWGGLIADRVDNRRLIIVTQGSSAVLSFLLAALSGLGVARLPVLIPLVFALGLVNVLDTPSRQILINQLVERRYLVNAIGLNSIMVNTAKIVGPAVAGVLIVALGVTPCFFINAASFAAVILSLLLMRPAELLSPVREVRAKGQITDALRYIRATPTLLYPLLMVIVTGILTQEFPVTLPLITTNTFHGQATAYGAALTCMAVGGLAGGLVAARRRRLSVRSLTWSAIIWGTLIVIASLAPNLATEFAVLVFVGAASITFNSSIKTQLQLESTPQMRGRVVSLWAIAWQGGTVVGAPIVGAVGAVLGARYGLMLSGVAAVAIGVIILALRVPSPAVAVQEAVVVALPDD